jgi:uncharacterized membrane protein YdjX (TVP38/TMEM64 family)/rhodanese-related sulfurtransferase
MTRARWLRLILVLALVGGIALVVGLRGHLEVAELESTVRGLGAWAPLGFVALYAAAVVLFAPGSVLTLAGGALFGPVWGTLINLTGATLGATLAFLIARYLASDWVRGRGGPRLAKVIHGVEAERWRFVAFTRLVPLFPFNLLNYVLGLTRIPLAQYAIATLVFMLPGAIVYTYLGYAGREALSGGEGLLQKGFVALSLLAALAFVPRLVARLRERPMLQVAELRQRIDCEADLLVLDVRTAEDFVGEQGHIDGAVNVPLEVLETRIESLGDDPERPIAIVCRTDRRSAKAAGLLARRGFADVHVVQGGMTAWNAAGWPVAR